MAGERPLKRLVMLGLLERRVPALKDPARSKRAIYRLADPYFAFWFRFVAGHRPEIARGLGAAGELPAERARTARRACPRTARGGSRDPAPLYGRAGCGAELRRRAGLRCYSLADMYAEAAPAS